MPSTDFSRNTRASRDIVSDSIVFDVLFQTPYYNINVNDILTQRNTQRHERVQTTQNITHNKSTTHNKTKQHTKTRNTIPKLRKINILLTYTDQSEDSQSCDQQQIPPLNLKKMFQTPSSIPLEKTQPLQFLADWTLTQQTTSQRPGWTRCICVTSSVMHVLKIHHIRITLHHAVSAKVMRTFPVLATLI